MVRARSRWRGVSLLALAAAMLFLAGRPAAAQNYAITILHNNDGESRLTSYTDALSGYGGIARFKTMLDQTRSYYEGLNHGVVSIYAGDTFLPGAQFQASLDSGAAGSRTFYDALAISRIGYDASIIGNHEFDFGPAVLAEFIGDAQTTNPTTYLSSNLNFSGEATLQAHVAGGRIAPSKLVDVTTGDGTKKIGIIGATTESLAFVSSPGGVTVGTVASAVNAQIAALKSAGAHHIVLGTHLQGLATDNDLVANLDAGIDLIVAGGGDEILRTSGAPAPASVYNASAPASVAVTGLLPGDSAATPSGSLTGVTNTYPLVSTGVDKGGRTVPIVTAGGNYGYLGRVTLAVTGGTLSIDASSGPQRVADVSVDATHGVTADATVQSESVSPVSTFIAGLTADVRASTSVQLKHGGSSTIRSRQTNLGALVADALLHTAQVKAADFGVASPQVALVNGGGIRANVNAGNVTTKSTFDVSPFGNFVSVVEDLRLDDLKLLLENAYSKTSENTATPGVIDAVGSDGRFAHLGGMSIVYDITRQGMGLSVSGVTTAGDRIRSITVGNTPYLQDGTWLVDPVATTLDVAVPAFLAQGGDQYFRYAIGGATTYLSKIYDFTTLGVTDQQAFRGYVDFMAAGNSSFDVSTYSPDYATAESFQGTRINAVPEPATWLLAIGGIATLVARRCGRRGSTTPGAGQGSGG
jgi:5'-nucleotidase / UDP-sugar diphosphatase